MIAIRARQLADQPIGYLAPVIGDLIVPTDLQQPAGNDIIQVAFAVHFRHQYFGHRFTLPEWLKAHRTGDHTVVAVLLACDYALPGWMWGLPGAGEAPLTGRMVMFALRDGADV